MLNEQSVHADFLGSESGINVGWGVSGKFRLSAKVPEFVFKPIAPDAFSENDACDWRFLRHPGDDHASDAMAEKKDALGIDTRVAAQCIQCNLVACRFGVEVGVKAWLTLAVANATLFDAHHDDSRSGEVVSEIALRVVWVIGIVNREAADSSDQEQRGKFLPIGPRHRDESAA